MVKCEECDAEIKIPEDSIEGEIVSCPDCGSSYELVKIEGGLKVNAMSKRSDILIFNTEGRKTLLVECKASSVILTQKAFDQLSGYNTTHKANIIVLTNGLKHYCCEINHENKSFKFLNEVPEFDKAY